MPKVLILCAHRPGRSPSQRYRFEQYLPFLQENGFEFHWSYLLNEKTDKVFYAKGNVLLKTLILFKAFLQRCRDSFKFSSFDTIFIQREAAFTGAGFFEKLAYRSGARVIFDFDDSIWLADTSPGNKRYEWIKNPAKFFKNLRNAHLVIAGNSYLRQAALPFNHNTTLIPTTVNTDVHYPRPELRNKNVVTIGWSGSISTVKHFELLLPALRKIIKHYGDKVRLVVMAQKGYRFSDVPVEVVGWSSEKEVEVLNSFDIGVMPLPDEEWARGKCGLKALTYMACGVPVVLSPVGVNKEIVTHGLNGLHCYSEEEWVENLGMLIEDEHLRRKIGNAGRERVLEKYSVMANREKYLRAFIGG